MLRVRQAVRAELSTLLDSPTVADPMRADPMRADPMRADRVQPGPVVVACSGGADSLALMAATVREAHELGLRVVGATVDHGLQETSAAHAAGVVAQMSALGADETLTARVSVVQQGQGPEAAAREARYAVLGQVADSLAAAVVLLGHTRDDQAETVLLGLTRGSGARSLAGMRARFGPFARPLLEVGRADTEAACVAWGLDYWTDPHNADPRFTRARVRHTVLPVLEESLGPGVALALARTAEALNEDAAALEQYADLAAGEVRTAEGLSAAALSTYPAAIQHRLLRSAAIAAGSPAGELSRRHVLGLADLLVGRPGRRVQLPGHRTCVREREVLRFLDTRKDGVPGVAG